MVYYKPERHQKHIWIRWWMNTQTNKVMKYDVSGKVLITALCIQYHIIDIIGII